MVQALLLLMVASSVQDVVLRMLNLQTSVADVVNHYNMKEVNRIDIERICSEKDPGKADKAEGAEYLCALEDGIVFGYEFIKFFAQRGGQNSHCLIKSVEYTPDYVGKRRAVPDATDKEHCHYVENMSAL